MVLLIIALLVSVFLIVQLNHSKAEKAFGGNYTAKVISKTLPTLFIKSLTKDTCLTVSKIKIDIKVYKADLLVLPGWNFNRKLWCDSSALCKIALAQGYRLIMPAIVYR